MKMWLFSKRIKSFFLNIYHSTFVAVLRKSLVYNMFKAFSAVVVFLSIIFFLSPKSAHVSYTSDRMDAIGGVTAGQVRMDMTTNRAVITVSEPAELVFNSGLVYIDDEVYENEVKIVFKPEYEEYGADIFISEVDFSDFSYSMVSHTKDIENPVFIGYMDTNFVVNCANGFQLELDSHLVFSFTGGDAFMIKENGEEVPISSCSANVNLSERYIFGTYNAANMNVKNYTNQYVSTSGNIDLFWIRSIFGQGDGELNFSYTPTPSNYRLNSQQTKFTSSGDTLRANIQFGQHIESFYIYGMVDDAILSGMSLFPSFYGWFRDNVYLAPITLITTVFGGVTLMYTARKKE